MADQPLPMFETDAERAVRPAPRPIVAAPQRVSADARPVERKRSFLSTLDLPLVITLALLMAIGLMMVYSTTFDWSFTDYGNEATILLQQVKNMALGMVIVVGLILLDYRIWKRFAVVLLLVCYALLIGVLLFGDKTFGAQRAFIKGSYQPGELAELIIIVYMAAWMSSKRANIRSITRGLLPFIFLVGTLAYLVVLQPDLSTVAMICFVSGVMYFLAGARLLHLIVAGVLVGIVGFFAIQKLGYAETRVKDYTDASDLTHASYHVQQAAIAFINGGWTGVGLGEGKQKFGFLPAPHTDSIFAVIGEELGVVGASVVVLLYVVIVIRGFTIARRAPDGFGALLACGLTIWIASKALLNIAVMTAVVPATGAPLPLISFGGSSLVVIMSGMGLLLSISRASSRLGTPERRNQGASYDRSRGNGGPRLSRTRGSRGAQTTQSRD
jgi:cell division protein FtsW